ncbi:MAG: prepilin-type N-terminal cleavage/methylation domain-containing protein [Limisphaerales bacterium]
MRLNHSPIDSNPGGSLDSARKHCAQARSKRAFTLAEMLVVIAIIAILATIALPAIKGLSESNSMSAATRQLMDDVAFARQKAISGRTTVYMVFVPPEFWTNSAYSSLGAESQKQVRTLFNLQCTSYALFVERNLSDQLGRNTQKYLTPWRSLPSGVLIETNKFHHDTNFVETIVDPYDANRFFDVRSFHRRAFPFPPAELTNAAPPRLFQLPYIAFKPNGSLWQNEDELLPLARGSIFYQTNAAGQPLPPDIVQIAYREATRTNFTLIRIDSLTGRAKLERIELQ